jgi:twitching motility protein PilT
MTGGRYGQETHNDALVSLIQRGIVDPMEAYLRCQERDTFIAACKKAGIDFDPRGEGAITTDV